MAMGTKLRLGAIALLLPSRGSIMPVKLMFTWALCAYGGFWVEYADGDREYIPSQAPDILILPSEARAQAVRNAGLWVGV